MEKITGQLKIKKERLAEIKEKTEGLREFRKEVAKNLKNETTAILEIILAGAMGLDASDIHIEPEEAKVKIRLRVDGMLNDVLLIEKKTYGEVLSRIKLLSEIKLNVSKRAQDGRFTLALDKEMIEVRVSTLPSEYGESIVLRILNPKNLIEIEGLGLREDILEAFKREIKQPNGMIAVTGPTGCGKTSTLYAILKRIKSPEIKIITIEDPIEYHLEGISQSQVDPSKGYDFANGLKAIVRQDPDVILVGEIRDLETATISLQASLTGHLVLTTLHTNDAAGTVARFQALGEKSINVAPALNIAIAQRLVRKVCQKCAVFQGASEAEIAFLKQELKSLPKNVKTPKIDDGLKISKTKGCKFCNFTGYKGRVGIFEFFTKDDEMENFILKSPSISDLRKKAEEKGMVSMKKDGLIKVVFGQTTIEEVKRIVGE